MIKCGVSKDHHKWRCNCSLLFILLSLVATVSFIVPHKILAQDRHIREFTRTMKKYIKKKSEIVESWKGAPVHELLIAWGPPDAEFSDGAGGKILVYRSRIKLMPDLTFLEKHSFYVNRKGIIYLAVPKFGYTSRTLGERLP